MIKAFRLLQSISTNVASDSDQTKKDTIHIQLSRILKQKTRNLSQILGKGESQAYPYKCMQKTQTNGKKKHKKVYQKMTVEKNKKEIDTEEVEGKSYPLFWSTQHLTGCH